jgi:hypothetical protein
MNLQDEFEKIYQFDLGKDEDGDYTDISTSACFGFFKAGYMLAKRTPVHVPVAVQDLIKQYNKILKG